MTDDPNRPRVRLGAETADIFSPTAHPELYDGVLASRVMAFAVDLILVVAMTFAAYLVLLVLGVFTLGLAWLLLGIAFPAIALAYSALTLGGPRSATVGMRLMGVTMRTWYGERMPAILGAFHTLLFYFSVSILTPLVLLVPLFNPRRRCLHDYLCGTLVINSSATARAARG